MMTVELECKVRVSSHDPLREKLRAAGATYVGCAIETNRLFDNREGAMRAAGCGLRIRSLKVLEGGKGKPTLTYKGPRLAGPFKRREEIEVVIDDADGMAKVLVALGYAERLRFEKRRESWLLGKCRVELDELPKLGVFAEIEGPDEQTIRSTMAELGLSDAQSISASYAEMVAQAAEKSITAADGPITMTFS